MAQERASYFRRRYAAKLLTVTPLACVFPRYGPESGVEARFAIGLLHFSMRLGSLLFSG
jgi:hypothetical protein